MGICSPLLACPRTRRRKLIQ
ncbi:unnamed protein product [Victoria cruziana]